MLQPGAVLPRGYVVERVLGQGGMGAVYLAHQTQLGRRVAIKETVLQLPDPQEQALARAQFHQEAEILASLEHPGLVDVKDYFEEGNAQYLVMAFIDGETLESVLNRTPGFLPVERVIEWTCQVCDVLAYLHSHAPPVLIRDVKPANVMLDASGRVRLIDFGIARFCLPQQETVAILKGAGTIGFAPPEQFAGTPTDASSDIYSLGATLYSLLTRQVPPWSVALATGTEPLHAPSVFNPAVSRDLDAVVMTMMALRKENRYQAAASVKSALRALVPSAPAPAPPRPPVPPAPGRRFCTCCGATILPSVPHCPACGQAVADESGSARPDEGRPSSASAALAAQMQTTSAPPPPVTGAGGWPPAGGLGQMPPTGPPPPPPPAPGPGGWPPAAGYAQTPPAMPPPAYPPQVPPTTPQPGYPPQFLQPGPPAGFQSQASPFSIPPGLIPSPSPRRPLPLAWLGVALAVILGGLGLWHLAGAKKPSPSASSSPLAASAAPSALAAPATPLPSTAPAGLTPSDLGMEVQTMTWATAREMGIGYVQGTRLVSVVPGGPAALAGMQRNDVITHIGWHRIRHVVDVIRILAHRRRGETLNFSLLRNGQSLRMPVQVPISP